MNDYLDTNLTEDLKARADYLEQKIESRKKKEGNMSVDLQQKKEQRRKEGFAAVHDAERFEKYIKCFFYKRSKQYIVFFLQNLIHKLKKIHDQYYEPGKENEENDG